ncbi:hypothetical protein LIN78_13785 [Leeia sp. TBRC 13508]|uniref:ABC3 transporter permease C-terminal domain-containing protein n=1 Tax=Leeia speluncae TaxID=2884804 RepID=A0ABS8D8R4_9NEIS|nr:FtsX-like permease family protein [Leeia speluncae]MCB6184613.1 hypothetical protein [Leeia speluncae]
MFGWRLFWRDLNKNRLMVFTLLVAVCAMATIQFVSARLSAIVETQSSVLLGGDALVSGDKALPSSLQNKAHEMGLKTANGWLFPTMAQTEKDAMLVSAKAVESSYPLRGELTVLLANGNTVAARAPAKGSVWVDKAILDRLNLKLGQRIYVGDAALSIAGQLIKEPDARFNFNSLSPRLMLSAADLQTSGLVQDQSRISYVLMVAGESPAMKVWSSWAKLHLPQGARVEDATNTRGDLKPVMDNAQRFLKMAEVLAVVLALSAGMLSATQYVNRHIRVWAVLRTQGMTAAQLTRLYLAQFIGIGFVASVLGVVFSLGLQQLVISRIASLLMMELPALPVSVVLQSLIAGLCLILVVALPAIWQLRNFTVIQLLRLDAPVSIWSGGLLLGGGLLAIIAYSILHNVWITFALLAGLILWCALVGGLVWVIAKWILKLSNPSAFTLRMAMNSLLRQPALVAIQAGAISLGLIAILLVSLTATRLVGNWESKIPSDAPNRFVINLQSDQLDRFKNAFQSEHITAPTAYPMIRGRLQMINQHVVKPTDYVDQQTRRLATREFNLSWMLETPKGNKIVAGKAFDETTRNSWSVEQGIAEKLGVQVGDTLTYDIAGTKVTGKVANIRKLDWTSFQVNFFVIASPDMLAEQMTSYVSSFYLAPEHRNVELTLLKQMPNLTVIDVSRLLAQAKSIMDQLSAALQFILGFSIISGALVLWSALAMGIQKRQKQVAILKGVGGTQGMIARLFLWEYLVLGGVTSLIAVLGNEAFAAFVNVKWLEVPYQPSSLSWTLIPVITLAILLVVMPLLLRLLKLRPAVVFRNS